MEQQQLKEWLKKSKEFEEMGSFAMGIIVVVILVVVVGYGFYQVRSLSSGKTLFPTFQTATPTPVASQLTPEVKQQRTHVVKKSEGLWQIAQQYYNDGNQYNKIYEANKDKMKNPEDINEGMQLVIPE